MLGDCIDQDCDGYTGDVGCEPIYVGSYTVDSGPGWTTDPPVYTCLEACAQVFGGVATDYTCSLDPTTVTGTANSSTWGVGGCGIIAEDFSQSPTGNYNCGVGGCATSAYVQDNCSGGTNHCFQWP